VTQLETETPRYEHDADATAKLLTEFSRSESFPVNRYAQIRHVTKPNGKYVKAQPDESFEFCDFEVMRYGFSHAASAGAIRDADWDILAQHRRIPAQRAMTNRTIHAVGALTDEANYLPGHVAGPCGWSKGTIENHVIKRALARAIRTIHVDTFAAVKHTDFRIVLNPETAGLFAHSGEIEGLLKVNGVVSGRNRDYHLPDELYGIEVVVEDAVHISAFGGGLSRNYVMPLGVVVLVARPGGLVQEIPPGFEGKEGLLPTLSTLTFLMHEEMAVDRLTEESGDVRERITDEYATVATAPVSGFLFKNVA
jgi:hypothetical protein